MSSSNNNGDVPPVDIDGTDTNLGLLLDDDDDALSANKRAALAGQWRTPPAPAYASGGSASAASQVSVKQEMAAPTDITAPQTLPGSSEDYAKALQEAYRKGAEAARLAQQGPASSASPPPPPPATLHSAASCPDLTATTNITDVPDPLAGGVIASGAPAASSTLPPRPEPVYHHQQQQHPQAPQQVILQHVQYAQPPTTMQQQPPQQQFVATTAAAPLPPQTVVYMHPTSPHPPTVATASVHHAAAVPKTHPVPPTTTSSGGVVSATAAPTTAAAASSAESSPAVSSSMPTMRTAVSMPDMSSYAAKSEEEKRRKRLARNRASARLRRLRKKNLVDAYETEVGILEKTLKQLQSHEWGKEDDPKALLESLGMERGQQAIAPEQRTEIIQDILQQQMQQVQLLRQAQMEQQCLALLANQDGQDQGMGDLDDDLARELQDVLQLTDNQKSQLRESSKGLDQEVEALETVAASLQAMHDNEWLVSEGVQKMTDQFMSILHKNQQSKFLLWSDANAEAIDQLDYVQVQPLQNAPIFTFGVETNPGDDEEK
mmetsp:Transcript_34544/g.83389  ORF Transcript_34544/g.83389 Transcript_34544/m.83389 type:complete len:547 (+) Transcript_34544:158-1798(+)